MPTHGGPVIVVMVEVIVMVIVAVIVMVMVLELVVRRKVAWLVQPSVVLLHSEVS